MDLICWVYLQQVLWISSFISIRSMWDEWSKCTSALLSEETETIQSETFHLLNQVGFDLIDSIFFKLLEVSSEKLFHPPFFLKKVIWSCTESTRSAEECGIGATWRKRKVQSWHRGRRDDGIWWTMKRLSIKRWNGAVETSSPCEMWNNVRMWDIDWTDPGDWWHSRLQYSFRGGPDACP